MSFESQCHMFKRIRDYSCSLSLNLMIQISKIENIYFQLPVQPKSLKFHTKIYIMNTNLVKPPIQVKMILQIQKMRKQAINNPKKGQIPTSTPSLIPPSSPQQIFTSLSRINYSSLSSLQSCLKDTSTLQCYHSALNQSSMAGKIVMHLASDINCLYSLWAAKAGAKKVYCVLYGHGENQKKNKYMIQSIVKENQYEAIISVELWNGFKIQGDGKVDVIVGQPMGYNLFYDGMLQRMIQARDMYLNQTTGILMPNHLRYKCALIWDEYQKDEKVQYWNEVYGISMKNMKKWVLQQPDIRQVDPTLIISQIANLFQFNLYKVNYTMIDQIKKVINIRPLNTTNMKANGMCIWFQATFTQQDGQNIVIDTSPWSQQSKWTNFSLYTKKQLKFQENQAKKIQFLAVKNHLDGHAEIKLKVDGQEEIFTAH